MPIRWRLTLFHALTMLLVVALLTAALIGSIFFVMHLLVERPVRERANDTAALIEASGALEDGDLAPLSEGGVFLAIRDTQGNIIAQAGEMPETISVRNDVIWERVLATGFADDGEAEGYYIYVVPVHRQGEPQFLVEAGKAYTIIDQGSLRITIAPPGLAGVAAGAALISILPAIVASYLMARRALAPVNSIVGSVQEISEKDLSQRLPVGSRRDELGRLSLTFNELLARLEVAFADREATLTGQRRFVANAGHELRTPLSSILGYARLLRQWGLEDSEVTEESLTAIEREAARMSELVEEMLDLARGDEGVPLALEPKDTREIITGAVEAARVAAGSDVEINFEYPAEPIIAEVDPGRFHQAASILLDNAIKYTSGEGAVTVRLGLAGEYIELQVEDTGIGIGERHLPYIFDRFYRVDSARSHFGSGLGLSIAYQIAEMHSGDIAVTSHPGTGSTFTLRLPRSTPSEPQ